MISPQLVELIRYVRKAKAEDLAGYLVDVVLPVTVQQDLIPADSAQYILGVGAGEGVSPEAAAAYILDASEEAPEEEEPKEEVAEETEAVA